MRKLLRNLPDAALRSLAAEFRRAQEQYLTWNPLRRIRHPTRGIIPLKLFARQREFIERYRRTQKIVGWDGPNRAGKSLAAGLACVEVLTGWPIETWEQLPWQLTPAMLGPPRRVGCITVSARKSIDGQQQVLAERLPRNLLRCRPWTKRNGFGKSLVLANGSTVDFLSDVQRPQELEQYEWDLVWIDEAVKEWVLHRIIARLIDRRGKILITCVAESRWIKRVLRKRLLTLEATEPVSADLVQAVAESTMYDNELLDPAEIQLAIDTYGGRDARDTRMRVLGEYVDEEGLVFPEFDEARHVAPAVSPSADWTIYEGWDPGYAVPFAVLFAGVDDQQRVHCFGEIYDRGRTPQQIAARALEMRRTYGYDEPYVAVIDPASAASTYKGVRVPSDRELIQSVGVSLVLAETPPGSIEAGYQSIRHWLMTGRLIIHANCPHLIRELAELQRVPRHAIHGDYVGDRVRAIQVADHLVDALRYIISRHPHYRPPAPESYPRGSVGAEMASEERERRRRTALPWRR